jgi:hypothetical protein
MSLSDAIHRVTEEVDRLKQHHGTGNALDFGPLDDAVAEVRGHAAGVPEEESSVAPDDAARPDDREAARAELATPTDPRPDTTFSTAPAEGAPAPAEGPGSTAPAP